jgi:hypothetical protein
MILAQLWDTKSKENTGKSCYIDKGMQIEP